MTQFIKKNFIRREYTEYDRNDGKYGTFVARFKYLAGKHRTHFINFLVENFTQEEYFGLMDLGFAPQCILEMKGYVSLVHELHNQPKRCWEKYDEAQLEKIRTILPDFQNGAFLPEQEGRIWVNSSKHLYTSMTPEQAEEDAKRLAKRAALVA